MRLLIVEDEASLARSLKKGLVEEGYAVDVAPTAAEARFYLEGEPYDLVLLDLMLPDGNGYDLLDGLRRHKSAVPVLILTARAGEHDKVKGLDAGADDYLTKPFSFAELLARIRALLRRGPAPRPARLAHRDLTLDPASRELLHGKIPVALTPKEFALLYLFIRRPGEVITRTEIIEKAYDFEFDRFSNVVDVHIRNLRRKLDPGDSESYIQTARGVGYRLK
jgi:two-component system OmpR family response regulator